MADRFRKRADAYIKEVWARPLSLEEAERAAVEHRVDDFLVRHADLVERAFGSPALREELEREAEVYNDLYKFTMLPVMHKAEQVFGQIHCTFSVNVREASVRVDIERYPELRAKIAAALERLCERHFDPVRFERTLGEKTCMDATERQSLTALVAGGLDPKTSETLPAKRLADAFHLAQPSAQTTVQLGESDQVSLWMFQAPDAKLQGAVRWYFEAHGPWHRVTWLETSMMQAVYSAVHDWQLEVNGQDRVDWAADALVRCALGVDAMNRVNASREQKSQPLMKHSFMAGRRSGGIDLMVLQTLYMNEHLVPGTFMGTSSLTAQTFLNNYMTGKPGFTIIPVMGTIAHELFMVLGSVLSKLDDEAHCPLSQVVGHLLYASHSAPPGRPLPCLPDTLTVKAFIHTLNGLTHPETGAPVIDLLQVMRQDSGGIASFATSWREAYPAKTFFFLASEIENSKDIGEAEAAGYGFTGAGGFYGDSLKAWGDSTVNISMAVKVATVFLNGARISAPVKTGDSSGNAKVEYDGTLSADAIEALLQRTLNLNTPDSYASLGERQRLLDACWANMKK